MSLALFADLVEIALCVRALMGRFGVFRFKPFSFMFGMACLLPWFASTAALAAIGGMPSTFSNHMVLQCEKPLPIWGSSAAGGKVTVEFAGQKKGYKSHEIDKECQVRIQFTHVGQGLAFRHGYKLHGFALAGADKEFHWADAVIDRDTVVVSSPKVPAPKAVRYAWSGYPAWANLFNKDVPMSCAL